MTISERNRLMRAIEGLINPRKAARWKPEESGRRRSKARVPACSPADRSIHCDRPGEIQQPDSSQLWKVRAGNRNDGPKRFVLTRAGQAAFWQNSRRAHEKTDRSENKATV